MPATPRVQLPDPPTRKPQRLRERHTTESDLLVEKRIQDTEILTLAHQFEQHRLEIERLRLLAIKALKKGDPAGAMALLDSQAQVLEEQATVYQQIVAAEKRDVSLNQQTGDILRLREKEWRDEA